MAARHFKYTYNSEIPPKTILSRMLATNVDDNYVYKDLPFKIDLNNENNKRYFNHRKELKNLMKSVNSHIDNNSQSLFLTLYYMDMIFTNKDLEQVFFSHFYTWKAYGSLSEFQMNYYVLLSLACLIVASKFNENDPHVPTISSYIRLLYEYSKKKYMYNLDSLFMAEVVVVKLLKYKLNYYTIYHYLIFFFTHGILFRKTIEKSKIFKKYSERKILEKIYIQSREILDGIIESEKYFDLYFGKDNHIIVIEIFLWSIEHVMNIKLKDDENIFKVVFNISVEEKKHKEIYEIIQEIYKNTKKRNNLGNKSTRVTPLNTKSSKVCSNFLKESESESSTLFSSKPQASDINFKYVQPKKSLPTSTVSYGIAKPYYDQTPPTFINQSEKNLQIYSGLIENEIERFNPNIQNNLGQYHIPHQSMIKNESWAPQTGINYGPNNRIYLTSYKNLNKNYQINSADNNEPKSNIVNDSNSKTKPFIKEKEPIDNEKNKNAKYINNNKNNMNNMNNMNNKNNMNNMNNMNNIDYNKAKIIVINDSDKIRKKSSSCTKNIYNYDVSYDCHRPRQSANIINNTHQLNLEENIGKVKLIDNVKKINNYYYNHSPHNHNDGINKIKIDNENLYKQYQPNNKDFFPNKSYNPNFVNDNIQSKFNSGDQFLNRTKNLFTVTKLNSNLELEPQDNNRRSSNNKYYINSGMKPNINKNYSKSNTIIINNNIHINTFIDKNNLNINKKEIMSGNVNKNLFLFKEQNGKGVNDLYNESNLTNKFKNIRNKSKVENDDKKSRNKNNKSTIVFSHGIEKNSHELNLKNN